jgi:hypothetical protein
VVSVREYITDPKRRPLVIVATAAAIGVLAWVSINALGPSPAIAASRKALYICAQTHKSFEVTVEPGMTSPVLSPYSDQKTGYPAELCYWTPEGQTREQPTPVLLNSYLGKSEPTFCPDCARLVRPRNPRSASSPPPTVQQYQKSRPAAVE